MIRILSALLALALCLAPAFAEQLATRLREQVPACEVGCGHTASSRREITRDARGKIKRSTSERVRFKRLSGYPRGRPGYQIDHIVPLKRGGVDCACNMQWLGREAKRAKDRVE